MPTVAAVLRVAAMMAMRKIDVAQIEAAVRGKSN